MRTESEASPRRAAIIAAAEKVFDANGYAATTMAAIAAQAGIAKGSIYNYFESKQDLFTQVCVSALDVNEADLDRLVAGPASAPDKIRAVLDRWHERLGRYARVGRLILEFWATAAREKRRNALPETLEKLCTEGEQQVRTILEQGIRAGEFSRQVNAGAASAMIMAVLRGITVQAAVLGEEVDAELVAELKRGLLAGLGSA